MVWATTGVALLTAISGPVRPTMDPFSEIPANTRFALANDATVQFLHYAACEEVTIRGGTVVLTSSGYTVEGGTTDRRVLPCRTEAIRQSGRQLNLLIWESGSVLLRGGPPGGVADHLMLPSKTVFVVVGNRARTFSTVRLTWNGVLLAEMPMQTRRLEWPEDILKAGVRHEMLFLPKESGGTVMRIPFEISSTSMDSPQEALVLIDCETDAGPTSRH
jgi:hypothetical protein